MKQMKSGDGSRILAAYDRRARHVKSFIKRVINFLVKLCLAWPFRANDMQTNTATHHGKILLQCDLYRNIVVLATPTMGEKQLCNSSECRATSLLR